MKACLLYLLAGLIIIPASAAQEPNSFVGGKRLHDVCSDSGEPNVCMTFILGVIDTHSTFVTWGDIEPLWCRPVNATAEQMRLVVQTYLKAHPEELHYAASGLVAIALRESFPCH